MVPPPLWARTDSLRPADLSRIAHAQIPAGRLPGRYQTPACWRTSCPPRRYGSAVDARPARLPNRLRVSRDVAEIAARHLAPPSRPE
jgi:hypothetical protein